MKIVIVGAGTSGWSIASLLSISKKFEITIVEPADIPTIGVGESTIPYINVFHNNCRLPFYDENWLNLVTGTMKFGILFDDYYEKGKGWFHPFINKNYDYAVTQSALSASSNEATSFSQTDFIYKNYFLGKKISNGYLEPQEKLIKSGLVAYHIDAKKYADLLKKFTLQRNFVELNTNSVNEVVTDNNGFITKLIMSDGEELCGDLFIDCTGFNSILSKKMNNGWIGIDEKLFVDTAVVAQLPYIDRESQLHNYTYCRALDSGWCWHIPLQSRIGFGYNYSSRHITHDQAENEFKNHLSEFYGYDSQNILVRRVPYSAGRRETGWKNNVVSIGLSGFFLEPIEATAIATLHNLASILFNLLTSDHIVWNKKIERFNDIFEQSIETTTEYIQLHYTLTQREDTEFWKEYKSMPLTENQKKILIGYADPTVDFNKEYVQSILPTFNLFDHLSYFYLFYGAGILPNCGLEKIEHYLYK